MGRRSTCSSTVALALLSLGAPVAAQKVPGTNLGITELVVVAVVIVVIVSALAFTWLFFCYHICKSRMEYQRVKERIKQNAISERARRQQHQQQHLRLQEGEGYSRLAEDGSQQPQSPARLGHTHFTPTSLSSLARSPSTDLPFFNPHQHSTPTHSGTASPLHAHFPDASGISEARAQTPGPDSDSRGKQVGFAFPNPQQHLDFLSHSHSSVAITSHQPPSPRHVGHQPHSPRHTPPVHQPPSPRHTPPVHQPPSPRHVPPGHHPHHSALSPYHGQLRSVQEDEEIDVRPEVEDPPRYSRLYPREQWGRSPTRTKDSMAEFGQLSSWPQFT